MHCAPAYAAPRRISDKPTRYVLPNHSSPHNQNVAGNRPQNWRVHRPGYSPRKRCQVRTIVDCHAHTCMYTYVALSNTFTIHGTRVLTQYRDMLAILSAHSPGTSMADYALPCDAFRGLSPTEKTSWAAVGAAFNTKVFGAVEEMFAERFQGVADQVDEEAEEFRWPSRIPRGRPIQEETLRHMVDLMAVDPNTGVQPCPCIAVVQPPGTGVLRAGLTHSRAHPPPPPTHLIPG
jgi:hypothetical protein